MADLDLIKRNLGKMIDQGAPESDINAYLSTEGYSSPEAWRSAIAQPGAKPKPVGAAMVAPSPRIEDAPSIGPGPNTSSMPSQPDPQSWSDVGRRAVSNILPSAAKAGENIYTALRHPLDTGAGLANLFVGTLENLPQPRRSMSPEKRAQAEAEYAAKFPGRIAAKEGAGAVGNYLANRFGGVENIKETIASDPVGFGLDASIVSPTVGAALPGRVGSIVRSVDPLTAGGNVLKGAGKVAETAGSNVLGRTTGAGTESIRAAGRAGREGGENAAAFTENMRGAPVSDVVDRARSALDQIRAERSAAYKGDMAKLGQDNSVLSFDGIDSAVDKASQVGSFKGVSVEPAAADVVTKMKKQVEDWKSLDPGEYHTAVGIDALKRALGNLRDSTGPNTPERVAADRIYNAVRSEITGQAPEYAKTMEAYGKASDLINEASKTFSLRDNAITDTAARKLLSATRNNVQTNYGERGRLLNVLAEKDPTLPSAIAGQALNSLPPRGIVANAGAMAGATMIAPTMLANPVNALTMAAFSPRIVGEAVYAGGKLVGAVDDVAAALGITPQRLRLLEQGGFQSGRADDVRQRAMSLRENNALAAP